MEEVLSQDSGIGDVEGECGSREAEDVYREGFMQREFREILRSYKGTGRPAN